MPNYFCVLGAFGKVRLCKIKKSNIDHANSNLSAPVKSMSSVTLAKVTGKEEKGNASASKASTQTEEDV